MAESEKELLSNIGDSIKTQRLAEVKNHANNPAIGRVFCNVESTEGNILDGKNIFWLINNEYNQYRYRSHCEIGKPVYKNTRMGEILSKYKDGKHSFTLRTNLKRLNKVDVQVYNRSVYTVAGNSVKEITVNIDGDRNTYYFQYLEELIKYNNDLNTRLAEKKKQEEENKIAIELARKAKEEALKRQAEEEAEQLRLEEQRRLEEEKKNKKDIANLSPSIIEGIKKEIAGILYATRNSIVHAKSNYTVTGKECHEEDLDQLNEFMAKLCECLFVWNSRQNKGLQLR